MADRTQLERAVLVNDGVAFMQLTIIKKRLRILRTHIFRPRVLYSTVKFNPNFDGSVNVKHQDLNESE